MKKNVCLLAAALLAAACQPSAQRTTIEGTLEGVESDTLLMRSVSYDAQGRRDASRLDTVPMQAGRFSISLPNDSTPTEVYLYAKPKGNLAMSMTVRPVTTLVFPGQTVTLSGSMDDCRVEGGDFHRAMNEIKEQTKPYTDRMNAVTATLNERQKNGTLDEATMDSLRGAYNEALDQVFGVHEAYIRQHPDDDLSVYLVSSMGQGKAKELMPLLTDRAKNGALKGIGLAMQKAIEETQAREKARAQIVEGAEAPDFTLKDLKGNDLALSSLRGKYVVLDFWGSWCGWCIKGIPDMKKYYTKYKDRMEILGIDCRDTEEAWKKAVEKHELPWLHVRNTDEADVTVKYGIQGYPTKIVIDPQGKIAKVVVGEDPAFYTYLDELFK